VLVTPPFRCGICTSVFSVPPGGFQKLEPVFFIGNVVASFSSGGQVSDPNDVKCQLCEEGDATVYCPECCRFMCRQCLVFHGRSPASKHHSVTSIDEALSGKASTKRIPRCSRHPTLEIDTFCTCKNVSVCPKCVTESHSFHRFHPLSQEADELRDEILDSVASVSLREQEAKGGITLFSASLSTLDQNAKTAEEDIRSTFRALHAYLDARQKKLLDGVEQKKLGIKKNTELEKGETEFAYSEFKGFREFNESLLAEGTPVEIATSHPVVCFPCLSSFSFFYSF